MDSAQKSRNKLWIGLSVLLSILVLSSGFWWVSIRPITIKKDCDTSSKSAAAYDFVILEGENGNYIEDRPKSLDNGFSQKNYEKYYKDCLRTHGL